MEKITKELDIRKAVLIIIIIAIFFTASSLVIVRKETTPNGIHPENNFYLTNTRDAKIEINIKDRVKVKERCSSDIWVTSDNTIRRNFGWPVSYISKQKIKTDDCENIIYIIDWPRMIINFLFYGVILWFIYLFRSLKKYIR